MAWQRAFRAVTGLALVAAAVAMQPLRLAPERLTEPITASAGIHEQVSLPRFSARLERVEFARSVRVDKQYGSDEAPTDQIFLVAKVGATAPQRPVQLHARLLTADGRRFDATERVSDTVALNTKWVQPGWWRSGLYFFEVPPDAVAGATVIVSEASSPLFGDQFLSEAAFDTGLDEAAAKRAVGAAKEVYEVSG